MPPSPFLGAIKEIAEFLGKKLDKVLAAVKDIKAPTLNTQPIVSAIERLPSKMKDPAIMVSVDTSEMEAELKRTTKELAKLKNPEMKGVENLLGSLLTGISQMKSAYDAHMGTLLTAVQSLQLTIPETIKLDDMQVRTLTPRMPTTNQPLVPRNVTVANVALTANTEGSYKFPRGTVSYELRVRETNLPLLVSYTTGKLPTSGDGLSYFTVPAYYITTNSGLDWGATTLYMQTASNSTVEVISYQAV